MRVNCHSTRSAFYRCAFRCVRHRLYVDAFGGTIRWFASFVRLMWSSLTRALEESPMRKEAVALDGTAPSRQHNEVQLELNVNLKKRDVES